MKKNLTVMLSLMLILSLLVGACGTTAAQGGAQTGAGSAGTGGGGGAAEGAEPLKVAFLYDSPVGDGGWISSHDLGREVVAAMPNVEVISADNVPESDGWNYMNNFAQQGYDLVFACSFGYMQDCLDVASKNPDTAFMHCAGYMTSDNMGNYFGRNYEAAYLAGMACGGVTKSNIIGYVAPFPIAEVTRNIDAFALGVSKVNPAAKVQLVWISAWYDPTLASEAAETLISVGADALFHYENSPAVVQTAAKHGVYACGQHSDASAFSPEYCLTSSVWDWGALYSDVVRQVADGVWEPEELWWGMAEGLVDITELNPVIPEDARARIEATRAGLKSGDVTCNPFYGEVVDQAGVVRLPEGTDASFDQLMGMDYLAQNVVGTLGT
ncbi:MAG: BMP family ABC transporter substrate-binding protein [Peptococcaceae bacterium]|jgi:basic membrane protein A|nr:BMP family ABC transporter substrate-binding protein [Peptococcaceae bacterium]